MSKKNKKGNSKVENNYLKIALPVLIGLVVVAVLAVVLAIVSKPDYNANITNPEKTYATVDGFKVTNEKMYLQLKNTNGVSEMCVMIDNALLPDGVWDSQEWIDAKKKVYENLVYAGSDVDELEEDAKTKLEDDYEDNLYISGYTTEEKRDEYFKFQTRRYMYALNKYKEYIEANDFTYDKYQEAYKTKYADEVAEKAEAIIITFQTDDEAKEVLKFFGIDREKDKELIESAKVLDDTIVVADALAAGWVDTVAETARQDQIKTKNDEIATLETEMQDNTGIDNTATINTKKGEVTELISKGIQYLPLQTVEEKFVAIYNFMYAYYQGGNVDSYYNADGTLKPEYALLKEGTDKQYTVNTEGYLDFTLDKLPNDYCKFLFTADETSTIGTYVKTTLFTNLNAMNVEEYGKSFLASPTSVSSLSSTSGRFFIALKLKDIKPENNYDFSLLAGETGEGTVAPSTELRDEIKAYLIEENFNDNVQTQQLIEMRKAAKLVIYDNFIDSYYGSSYEYLYGTTLKLEDYAEYEYTKKNNKTIAFSYELNGQAINVTADQLFESLVAKHGPYVLLTMLNTSYVMNNEAYNTIYLPATDKVLDKKFLKDSLNEFEVNGVSTTVKQYRYYFDSGYFESYGFSSSYGWDNFLKDYLLMDNEKELAANLMLSKFNTTFYRTLYTNDQLKAEMQKIWDKDYSLDVINLVVSAYYDLAASNSEYALGEEEQEFWTDEQIAKAKELINLFYTKAPETGKEGIEAQLKQVQTDYEEASYNDTTWGTFKKYGLKISAESKQTYTDASNLVEEFHTQMVKIYQEYEAAGELGKTFDAPEAYDEIFPTVYGLHKVSINAAAERTALDENGATDLAILTHELYDKYNADSTSVSTELGAAIKKYYSPAIEVLEANEIITNKLHSIRKEKFDSNAWVFENADDYTRYQKIADIILEQSKEEEEE